MNVNKPVDLDKIIIIAQKSLSHAMNDHVLANTNQCINTAWIWYLYCTRLGLLSFTTDMLITRICLCAGKQKPEASSTTQVLVGARCSGTYLYLKCIKPGISATSAYEHSHC